jgi:hypothetical protein
VEKKLNESDYVSYTFPYSYSIEFPHIDDDCWSEIINAPTAEFTRKWSSNEVSDVVKLLDFLFVGPILSLNSEERKQVLGAFRSYLEKNANKMSWHQNIYIILAKQHSEEMALLLAECLKNKNCD